jgi:hypothetical protein
MIRQEAERLQDLRWAGCPTTVLHEALELNLVEDDEPIMRLAIGDAVGQVYGERAGVEPVSLNERRQGHGYRQRIQFLPNSHKEYQLDLKPVWPTGNGSVYREGIASPAQEARCRCFRIRGP